ncbi:MAG: dihydropteridine reductase [Ruminococcaceae bacterium]|nr:dihydropteridine reductase [Oscillospiraceae bacterium]
MNRNDQNSIVEKIRTQYVEKKPGELDELRALDSKVKRPANVFAYVFGSISAIIMGAGMSLVMTDIGTTLAIPNFMTVGTVIGVIGMALAIVNYPIYKGILGARKKKYAAKIIEISERLMNK